MIADRRRIRAFSAALRQTITPDSIVLDIGTGAGIFALLACQSGARRVIAVEPDDVIELARELAVANGYDDRIEFIKDVSTNVTLAERANVIVSDIRGAIPLYRQHIPVIIDARERLLASGGLMIPSRDRIWAAVVEEPRSYQRYLGGWREVPGLDMEIARGIVSNTTWGTLLSRAPFLGKPQCWATLDYHTITDPNVGGRIEWEISRSGVGHGISLWFDTVLAEGVALSLSPRSRESINRSLFLPFGEPVPLESGDTVSVRLQASLVGRDYILRWDTMATAQADPKRTIASFAQCTLHGVLPAHLHRLKATHVPSLSKQGRLDGLILSRMAERISLDEIAKQVAAGFPDRFVTWDDAFDYVATFSARYSD